MSARLLVHTCWQSLCDYLPRASLAMVSVAAGVATVLVALSTGAGARTAAVREFGALGTDTVVVRSTTTNTGSNLRLTDATANAVRHVVRNADSAGMRSTRMTVTAGSRAVEADSIGITEGWPRIARLSMADGRWFNATDHANGRRVAILGSILSRDLGIVDALSGADLRIGAHWYRVVGVLASRGRGGSVTAADNDFDRSVFVPLTAFPADSAACERCIDELVVQSDIDARAMAGAVRSVLRRILNIDRAGKDGFDVIVPEELVEAQMATRRSGDLLLLVMGALSLVIGGIGTTNILLANVAERTAEIGVRRAVGATSRDIARQFGLEAVVLCATGGAAGLAIGLATAMAIAALTGWPMAMKGWTLAVPFAAALAVGVLAGIWPARRAASLAPMAAIRGE